MITRENAWLGIVAIVLLVLGSVGLVIGVTVREATRPCSGPPSIYPDAVFSDQVEISHVADEGGEDYPLITTKVDIEHVEIHLDRVTPRVNILTTFPDPLRAGEQTSWGPGLRRYGEVCLSATYYKDGQTHHSRGYHYKP